MDNTQRRQKSIRFQNKKQKTCESGKYIRATNENDDMQAPIRHIANKYLDKQLVLRARMFNIMAASRVTVSLLSAISALFAGDTWQAYVMYPTFILLSAGRL